jgi:hypothetical protein
LTAELPISNPSIACLSLPNIHHHFHVLSPNEELPRYYELISD